MPHAQIELLINIEAKMKAGKGKGYERWAERHNTDVLASSMLYLIDNTSVLTLSLSTKFNLRLIGELN